MKIKCRECGELFVNLPAWKEHADAEHDDDAKFDVQDEVVIKCNSCSEEFPDVLQWLEHREAKHDDDASYDADRDGFIVRNICPAPRKADVCKKILDNGWKIELWVNDLGSYSARAVNQHGREVDTDDFEPSQVLYRLTEKVFGRIV